MGYLGNTPGESFISFAKQVFTIVNSQTAYTLDFAVVDENELRLVINNVVQEPGSGKAYTASGTTLTLSAALTNGTDEMYCVFLGKARETVTVPTITRDKLNLISDASNPSLIAKGTSGVSEGYIQLNCAENSHGIKLKSPPHSAGQSYTLTFPSSITNNTFLKTDGSGNLSFASAGGDNKPYFFAHKNSAQTGLTNDADTKFQADVEDFDIGGCYNNTGSTVTLNSISTPSYSFAPNVAGKYMLFGRASMKGNAAGDVREGVLRFFKNNSAINFQESTNNITSYSFRKCVIYSSIIVEANGTSDYFHMTGRIVFSTNGQIAGASGLRESFFGAYKLIGV